MPGLVFAQGTATLTWNASSDPFAAGYNIYYGGTSGSYTSKISVGINTTSLAISNLNCGSTYYFATTTYSVSGAESVLSREVSYTIPVIPVNQPVNQVVTEGGTASFSVAASGSPPLVYQWSFNGTNVMGATNNTLTLNNVDPSQAGNYAVLVTGSNGSVLVSNIVLTVGMAPMITGQPANQSVMPGCDATFNASACGTGPLSYQWCAGGLAMNGQTSPSMTLTNIQALDFDSYCVVITNVFGAITSTPAQLALGQPPAANPDTVYRFASGGVRVNANLLMANDTVAKWDALTIVEVSPNSAAGGIVKLTNNWIYYAPPGSTTNEDTFTYMVSDGHCGTDVGTVTVQIKADNPQPLTFAMDKPGDGSIRLTFDGMPGYNYRIQHADDLTGQNWHTLGTQTADGMGVCQVVDWSPTNAPAQYYRAAWP